MRKVKTPKCTSSSLTALFLSAFAAAGAVRAEPLQEPRVFASQDRLLDLVMVAEAKPVLGIDRLQGWVYSICQRTDANQKACPEGSATVSDYGGARLALQPGDLLKVRFVNNLPKILDADHAMGHHAYLELNPTNLHTHGLIVEPRAATVDQPTFGDNVFVSVFNSTNGAIPVAGKDPATGFPVDMHGSVVARDFVDYEIDIPKNHPLGNYFFHPHMHGISLNQISMGLSGIITIGKASGYAKGNKDDAAFSDANVRHLVLKDIQVKGDGVALSQQSPDFCDSEKSASANYCAGVGDYAGGKWIFTVNGQQHPEVPVTSPEGEIWRITNASGNVTYNLQLDDGKGATLLTQLLSVDGVSINLPADTPPDTIVQLAGGRFKVRPCPGAAASTVSLPACVSEVTMMPSARAELWVAYRDAAGNVTTSQSAKFVLKQKTVQMGTGDVWPAVDLATVSFNQTTAPKHADKNIKIIGDALKGFQSTGIYRQQVPNVKKAPLPTGCAALPPGHRRRIFFGIADHSDPGSFGLGYEQIDQYGNVVASQDVKQFDPSNPFVCLPLAKDQKPAEETWELVNLATEHHNFHIHQTKFYQVTPTTSAPDKKGGAVLQDNLPLPVAAPKIDAASQGGACTMAQWHNGECASKPVVVNIPFPKVGEFVYHCHILEHEDGGMMSRIKVVASPN